MLFRCNTLASLALGTILLTACGGARGAFVWVDQYPSPAPEVGEYQIQAGDMVSIRVWDHEGLSVRARVRTDGKISVPLMDDVAIAGKTTADVAKLVESELKQRKLVLQPSVNVILEETKPLSVAVLGEVARAGMYTLDNGAGVAEALASAGGLTEFAHRDQIFVIRRNPTPVRIRFTYGALAEARGQAATFRLKPGDVVVAQ
jgi:polysaccharide export outer membrane protein